MWCLKFLDQDNQALLQLMIDEYIGRGNEQNWPDLHFALSKIVEILKQNIEPLLSDDLGNR